MDNKWKKPVMWIAVSITIAIGMIATKSIFCSGTQRRRY